MELPLIFIAVISICWLIVRYGVVGGRGGCAASVGKRGRTALRVGEGRGVVASHDYASRKNRYIYWKLMSVWYEKLRKRSRSDNDSVRKLRLDWISYVEMSGNRDTYEYLFRETEGRDSDEYRKRHDAVLERITALEDSFAAAMGKKAIRDLACARDTEPMFFGPSGERAPKGRLYDTLGRLRDIA